MQEDKYEFVKKCVKIAIIVSIILGVIGLAWLLTGVLVDNSYDTNKILTEEVVEETTEPKISTDDEIGGYSVKEFRSLSEAEKTLALMYDVPVDDALEASIKKSTIILSSSLSPYSKYMATAEYEAGKSKNGYKIDYIINGEKLSVLCTKNRATPVVYIKGTEFTDDEKKFFHELGRCWEVQLDDGSYSIQYR